MQVRSAICYVWSGTPTASYTGGAVGKLRQRQVGTRMIADTLIWV